MLFNSYDFILLFLPIAFALFWYGGKSLRWRLGLLTFASYAFYSTSQFQTPEHEFSVSAFVNSLRWNSWANVKAGIFAWRFTLVMLASSSVDYFAAVALAKLPKDRRAGRRALLALSLVANLGLLSYFKYGGFFSHIAADLSRALGGPGFSIIVSILPVGISFYTFESMSYVIDVYRGIATPAKSYLDYACFISFFPHLIAGPIIRYSDILHQFRDVAWRRPRPDWNHVSIGCVLFTMGMAKKLLLADPLAGLIKPLWEALGNGTPLGLKGSWAAVLGFTFQIYFDFSGYSDMAVGLGHMFAVRLPQNFDSPYKAANPSDFWRRWHMTLSLWLRDYLYIPLGGSRGGTARTVRNLLITMFLGGLWHGAAWLFIIWGVWQGLMLAGWHLLKHFKLTPTKENVAMLWFWRGVTFLLVVIGWTFFKAGLGVRMEQYGWSSITPAFRMLKQMFVPSFTGRTRHMAKVAVEAMLLWRILFALVWCNFLPNSFEVAYGLKLRKRHAFIAGTLLAICLLYLGVHMDFLYFRF